MGKKTILTLFLIGLLAFGLRFVLLTYNPPSLNWDEVSHGYNAYSILKTGMDEWGKNFPITNFRAYGDYPLPLNLYLTIPFVAIFGLTEFAVRFPHVILGTLTVISGYFLAFGLTKNKKTSLITAFLLAISPWTLFTSRFVLQSNLAVFLLTTAFAFFFNRDKNRWFSTIFLILLGLSLFAYNTTRIFSPIILLSLLFIYKKEILNRLNILVIILFFLPLPFILSRPEARARSSTVSIVDDGAVAKIIEMRENSKFPRQITRFIYNRPTYFIGTFLNNYVGYYSPRFLFLNGGTQYQFSVPNEGLISWVNIPFFYVGLFWLLTGIFKKSKDWKIILIWLLLAPIPAAITKEPFAVLRSSAMIPIPFILSAIGIEKTLKKNFLLYLYFAVAIILLGNYLSKYFGEYRTKYSWAWQYGYKEVVDYAKNHYNDYDKIVVSKIYGEPHEFFLFFWPWNPESYRNDPNLIRFGKSGWFWVDRFDKFYFVNDWQIPHASNEDFVLESGGQIDCRDSKCLLITSPGNVPTGWDKLETINFLDDKPAFEIYGNN